MADQFTGLENSDYIAKIENAGPITILLHASCYKPHVVVQS